MKGEIEEAPAARPARFGRVFVHAVGDDLMRRLIRRQQSPQGRAAADATEARAASRQ